MMADHELDDVFLAYAGPAARAEGIPTTACGYTRPTAEALAWVAGWEAPTYDTWLRLRALKRSRAASVLALPPWWP